MRKKRLPIDFLPDGSRLTFIRLAERDVSKPSIYAKALYRCSCGVEKEINIGNAKMGKVVSCGCYQKEEAVKRMTKHGLWGTPLFKIWTYMITRCENENSWAYQYYGAIGVTICPQWRNDFKSFYDWSVANGWQKGLTIDKDIIPKKLGIPALLYSPEMCCWVTHKENCNARKSNHLVEFNGRTQTVTQWEEELGFGKDIISFRLNAGWSIERALTQPKRKSSKRKKL